jgi:hypothetical protein
LRDMGLSILYPFFLILSTVVTAEAKLNHTVGPGARPNCGSPACLVAPAVVPSAGNALAAREKLSLPGAHARGTQRPWAFTAAAGRVRGVKA